MREMIFERVDGAPFLFDAGQWVNLVLPLPEGDVRRAYSIASAPSSTPRFELAVTRVSGGPGSEYLHGLEVGAAVHAIGPHGLFTRAPLDPAPALFIATGTGITPLRSMLHAALQAGSEAPMWILFGARFEEDILYRQEFTELSRGSDRIRYDVTLSQGAASWSGRRGYVQEHVPGLLEELSARSPGAPPHLYICGLERMVSAVRQLARGTLGVDRKRVHVERYD
ncbi:Flavodoxin reductases (ferredoxin-NADPH reductases) family 1 [Chondromyces apiculatus DSM 436]|uniref:Flavodoxin reductases (Ferredoxin-NADPH reductases) family 1 n=1 Tax=Chondromyces apiculatus DSM 436 TaxID=1192034 RepID=A0A017TCL2_9BACT|nr:Flavodoxin reductases (ferredoxin-NADPH reductases) family 1 [Chondromyces apiculatus DSM 436]